MDFITTFLRYPVTIGTLSGLVFGLLISLIILVKTRFLKKELEDEIADTRYDYRRLEELMNTQMRVTAKAQDELTTEIEGHQKSIVNLQTSLASYKHKPGRKELRLLHTYERAQSIMTKNASGSVLAWENAKKEAEAELLDTDKGIKPILRKVFGSDGAAN